MCCDKVILQKRERTVGRKRTDEDTNRPALRDALSDVILTGGAAAERL